MKIGAINQESFVNVFEIGEKTKELKNKSTNPLPWQALKNDVVEFKSKVPPNKQDIAYKKLERLKKEDIVDKNIYNVLLKDIKSNNKNVIKILNNIETKNVTFKNNKEKADNIVNKHAKLAKAISYSKNNSDLRQSLLNNELKMIKNVSAVYGKKLPFYIENNVSDIGFGGRKGQAAWVVQKHTGKAVAIAATIGSIPFADMIPLMDNENEMAKKILKIYGIENPADEKSDNVSIAGLILGGGVYAGLQAGAIEAAKAGAKETVKALFGWIPGVGSALNAAIACGTTEAVGFALIAYCEKHS